MGENLCFDDGKQTIRFKPHFNVHRGFIEVNHTWCTMKITGEKLNKVQVKTKMEALLVGCLHISM